MAKIPSQPHRQPAVLLTGFGPFPGMPDNASARLARALAMDAAKAFPAFRFAAEILPTEWGAVPQRLRALAAAVNPVLVLHFGVTRETVGFRIETRGGNACQLTSDAAGLTPRAPYLKQDGADWHSVTIPTGAIVARLIALGLPAALSDDAGGYLCNALLYHSLADTRAQSGASYGCGFIHIPADLTGPPLSFDDAVRGAVEIIGVCLSADAAWDLS